MDRIGQPKVAFFRLKPSFALAPMVAWDHRRSWFARVERYGQGERPTFE
jgi:hypothetical protein